MLHYKDNIKIIRKLCNETQEKFRKRFTNTTLAMQKSYEGGVAQPDILYIQELASISGISEKDLADRTINAKEVKLKVEKDEKVSHETKSNWQDQSEIESRKSLERTLENLSQDKIRTTAIVERLMTLIEENFSYRKQPKAEETLSESTGSVADAEQKLAQNGRSGSFSLPKEGGKEDRKGKKDT